MAEPSALERLLSLTPPRPELELISVADRGVPNHERIYLRADKAVSYGDLMEVMNLLRNAGYLKIALVGLDGRT